jgi:hypothetical protein
LLNYFPSPYEDELLYSVIARFGIHSGITSSRQLLSTLFLKSNVTLAVDFPGHLKTFVKCLGDSSSLSVDQWIQHHTLYPAYLAFSPAERQQQVLTSARSNNAANVHTRLGVCASFVKPPQYFRVCEQCQIEQRERLGESYWQRSLQLPGVLFCPLHKLPLYITRTRIHAVEKFDFNAAERAQIGESLATDAIIKSKNLLVPLARNFSMLLQTSPNEKMAYDKLSYFYVELAKKNNLLRGARVDHVRVEEKFLSYWKIPVSQIFPEVFGSDRDWLTDLFRKHRKSFHPLCHLMVWQAFDMSDPLLTLDCIYYFQPPEKHVIEKSLTKPTGEVAKKRKQWRDVCSKKHHGVKWLRQQEGIGALYAWLYRNDKDWLLDNTPQPVKLTVANTKVDWGKRDKELLESLEVLDSKHSKEYLRFRKSKTWFIRHSDAKATLEKHLDKLPLCKNFIDSHLETVEEFHQRKIVAAVRELTEEGSALPTWVIIRRAGIREQFVTDTLIKFIQDLKEPKHGSSNLPCNTQKFNIVGVR